MCASNYILYYNDNIVLMTKRYKMYEIIIDIQQRSFKQTMFTQIYIKQIEEYIYL